MDAPRAAPVERFLRGLQKRILAALQGEEAPGAGILRRDPWAAQDSGGLTCVLADGEVFERAAVNFSRVQGERLPQPATERRPELAGCRFEAVGLSVIIHPRNPYVPTSHANLRFFVARDSSGGPQAWWFGGGMDLTPVYPFEEDVRHWHRVCLEACAPFGEDLYRRLKEWCDRYFYLPHRREARGVGGLFFDDLDWWGFARCFEFVRGVGDRFLPAYLPIVQRRKSAPYGARERNFLLYRRGRYVEFNLLYDRGTRFGLQTGGRVESILASLPPEVRWHYDWQPAPGTAEARLGEFLQPRDWV